MKKIIQVKIYKGEKYYVAECVDLPVVSQGETLDKTVENIKEAISLHLEGEDAKIMADNLGVINKDQRDIARELILAQPNLRALMRNNHYEPYIQVDITPFFQKE